MASERRLAAIMFTDLVGFSALTQQNEALALELVDTKKQLLNPLLVQHKGSLIKTMGDGFLVEFSSALQAVQCAMGIQSMLQGYNSSQTEERRIKVRIGIHLGDVEFKDGDVFGDGVNIASRIEPLAEPGGICVSEDVARQVRNKAGVNLESLGTPELKNIEESFEVFKLRMPSSIQSEEPTSDLSKSIAVLPFENMSADPDNEYFSDGITEDIIAQLAKIQELKVISRTSIMKYKGTQRNLREVGSELGVGTVLEGSVRRAGNDVRIVAQLIKTETDEHLWAETYDRELTNIFEIQSDVAKQIAGALKAHVSSEVKERIEKKPTENIEAYQLYLQGVEYWNKRDNESLTEAKRLFEQAIALDPNYAKAYVGLANVHQGFGNFARAPSNEIYPPAIEALEKALQIDPNMGEAIAARATIRATYEWDWDGAEAEFKRAIEMAPNSPSVYYWYGFTLTNQSRNAESITLLEKALELDPLSLMIPLNIIEYRYLETNSRECVQEFRNFVAKHPKFGMGELYLGSILTREGQLSEALSIFKEMAKENRGGARNPTITMFLGYIEAKLGNTGEAFRYLNQLLEEFVNEYVAPTFIALLYMGFDNHEKSIEWLNRGVELRDDWLRTVKVSGYWDALQSDPRYQKILREIGLAN